MQRHLKAMCPRHKHRDTKMPELIFVSEKGAEGNLKVWKFEQDRTRRDVALMISTEELSFKFVESKWLRNVMRNAQPLYIPISRHTIWRDCLIIYNERDKKLKEELKLLGTLVSLTMDMWTSNQMLGYMCLAALYVTDDWRLRKKNLKFFHD